ncbi:hypothetical protein K438DRAFT_1935103 [Mycena galopus ATCC 62051]|nr:hypothetical protein K438DRAFT_1935103 [Mycena galopus ATCC 62051]
MCTRYLHHRPLSSPSSQAHGRSGLSGAPDQLDAVELDENEEAENRKSGWLKNLAEFWMSQELALSPPFEFSGSLESNWNPSFTKSQKSLSPSKALDHPMKNMTTWEKSKSRDIPRRPPTLVDSQCCLFYSHGVKSFDVEEKHFL